MRGKKIKEPSCFPQDGLFPPPLAGRWRPSQQAGAGAPRAWQGLSGTPIAKTTCEWGWGDEGGAP